MSSHQLNKDSINALGMPLVGFGTYQMSPEQAEAAVIHAIHRRWVPTEH